MGSRIPVRPDHRYRLLAQSELPRGRPGERQGRAGNHHRDRGESSASSRSMIARSLLNAASPSTYCPPGCTCRTTPFLSSTKVKLVHPVSTSWPLASRVQRGGRRSWPPGQQPSTLTSPHCARLRHAGFATSRIRCGTECGGTDPAPLSYPPTAARDLLAVSLSTCGSTVRPSRFRFHTAVRVSRGT